MNKHILTKLQAVALLAIILSGVGCYAVWRFAEPKAYFQVWGDVTLNAPLVGAKISILDQDGKTLATQQNATYTTGAFYFDIPLGMFQLNYALPSGLRIVAEGGTLNDEAFTGKATLIVPEYTNEGYYKVNAITTLAAAYHDKHPEITYAKTQATVETFLKVPDGVTLNNVISTSEWDDSVFSHTVFMWQANAAGGFNEFVNSLVTEIDQGKTHPITNELLFGWEWIDLGCWIGKSIAGGAVSSVAGAGVNWVLHNLGFRNPTEKMVEQLRDQMNVMQQNISTILTSVKKIESLQQATLQRIDDAVKQIGTKIDLAYKGLKWEVELSALKVRSSNLVSAIREPKETITTTFNRLYEYSKLDPANIDESFRNTVNKTVDEILSPIIGIEPKLMAIHDSIVGSLDEGLLDVWTSILTLAAPDKAQLESLFNTFMERFSYLLTLELMGANLMIDAYHAKFGDDTKLAKNFWASWKEKMENQLDLFLSFAERTAVSRIDTLTVSEFNNPNFFSKSSEGSTILQRSDEFYQEMMSSLEAEQNTRKTISLRVVNFPNVTSQKLPAEANIKLLNVNTGTAYSPSVTEFRNGTTVHDWEFTTANYEIAYFAFTVPPGSYRATTQTPALLREYDTLQNITWTATDQYFTTGYIGYLGKYESISAKPTLINQWSNNNPKNTPLELPKGITVDKQGYVYVTEMSPFARKPQIQKYDSIGNYVLQWGTYGSSIGQFIAPRNVAADNNGKIYVTTSRIQVFDSTGTTLTEWATLDTPSYATTNDYGYNGIATSSDGYIYAVDSGVYSGKPQIFKFDSTGKLILKFGFYGMEYGGFIHPGPIAVDKQGYVYVLDRAILPGTTLCTLQKFSSQGDYIWCQYLFNPSREATEGAAIAIDNLHGNIYVADSQGNHTCIQKLDSEGNFICEWGNGKLEYPAGIAINPDDSSIYITDLSGVKRFSLYPDTYVSKKW